MKLFLNNLRKRDYLYMLVLVGLIVVMVWLELEIPKYMKDITPLILSGAPTSKFLKIGAKMLLCAIASGVATIGAGFLNSRISASFSMRLRYNIFSKVESFSLEQIKRFSTASLITRSTNDVMQLQMFLSMGLQVAIRAPITAIWALCDISSSHWQYSVATAVSVALLIVTIVIAVALAMPKFKKMQVLTDNINRTAQENLEGVRVVRAYNAENFEKEKFEKANDALTKNSLFTSRVMSIMNPMMNFIMSALTLVIYWIGAIILANTPVSQITAESFGETMSFASIAMHVVMSFMLVTMIFIMLPRAIVSIRRLNEVLNTNSNIVGGDYMGNTNNVGEVEFRNVSFKYPDAEEYVLRDISFSISQGESVAFIGSTGSGKSTLVNLIPRFYDATDGEVFIDGVEIKDYNLKALRNKIGYISQKAIMFSGSVKDNLVFGDNGKNEQTNEDLDEALKIACANFVEKMDGGKDAFISQGGTNVSGGQKQRLSIARGLARKPEILIFDDTFSALDFKTDKKLRSNLKKYLASATKIIVAQRIGTIKDCNQIIVLNDGKIVGKGTHDELLKSCSVYKEIALSQLSEEEL